MNPPRHRRTMARDMTLLLGSTLTVMSGATISPALPAMRDAFTETPGADFLVKLLLTVPAVCIAAAAPLTGYLMDRWRRKPVLMAGLVLYAVAGTSGFWLASLESILVGRALLGVAVAAIMTGCTTLIGDYFEGRRLNVFMGRQAAFMGYGGVVFLLLGGMLADVGWRFPFLVYLGSLLLIPGALLALVEPPRGSRPAPAAAAGLAEFTAAGGAPAATGEAVDPHRMPPVSLIAIIYALAFLIMVIFYMIPVHIPFLIQSIEPVSNTAVGVAIAGMNLFAASASTQYHRLRARLDFTSILVASALVVAVGFAFIARGDSYAIVFAGLAVAGAGWGVLLPNLNVWLVSLVGGERRGRVVGGLTACLFLGQFFTPILTGPVTQALGIAGGFGAAGAVLLVVVVIVFAAARARGAHAAAHIDDHDDGQDQ
jgi:MFS family permease